MSKCTECGESMEEYGYECTINPKGTDDWLCPSCFNERQAKRITKLQARVKELEGVLSDTQRLTKQLDDLLNGVGAAEQASLCDIVSQVKREHIRSKCYVYPDGATMQKEKHEKV